MKTFRFAFFIVVVSAFTACKNGNSPFSNKSEIRKIDVTKTYPKKKLVLQDIADIRYIPIETNDDFLCSYGPRAITSNKIFIPENKSGDILIFDSNGRALNKINRKGGGAEEYNNVYWTLYDDNTGELYVGGDPSKIRVYTIDGKFLRTLNVKEDLYFDDVRIFDKDNLLCYIGRDSVPAFIVSRTDGSVTYELPMPFEKEISGHVEMRNENGHSVASGIYHFTRANKNGHFLSATSADTIYQLTPEKVLVPIAVREPSVQTMDTPVFLEYGPQTDRYTFMNTTKREFDWEKRTGFPQVYLFMDNETGEIFEQEIVNADFEGQNGITLNNFSGRCKTAPETGAVWLQTDMLEEAYEDGKLSGKLKEVVAKMNDDDNGVVMLLTFK